MPLSMAGKDICSLDCPYWAVPASVGSISRLLVLCVLTLLSPSC